MWSHICSAPRGFPPLTRKVLRFLEVILHIGAHRTGTSSLQRTLYKNREKLTKNDFAIWGPKTTRSGVFTGLLQARPAESEMLRRNVMRSRAIIAMRLEKLSQKGRKTLLVTEENILGSMRGNLRTRSLYPGLQERLARFHEVFGASCTRIGLAVRPYEDYWASSLAYTLRSGQNWLDRRAIDALVEQPRSWRNVVQDVARSFPNAEVVVWEFARLIGRPHDQFRALNGFGPLRLSPDVSRRNAAPTRNDLRDILIQRNDIDALRSLVVGEGKFMPFSAEQIANLRARYQQDMTWLRSENDKRLKFMGETLDIPVGPGLREEWSYA